MPSADRVGPRDTVAMTSLAPARPAPIQLLHGAGPNVLYGLRMTAAVALALAVAFWLQLDDPVWAATTAAITSQPSVGASLRKGWFRAIGTLLGGLAIVLLTACWPQSRVGMLGGILAIGAAAGFATTVLRNNAAYAAALAGYTAVIVFADAVGQPNRTFILAISRVSEILLGVFCAGAVIAGTDFGTARRRLAAEIRAVIGAIAGGVADTLDAAAAHSDSRPVRRALIRRVIALDPLTDEALGESAGLRYRLPVLHAALDGLFLALSAWRGIATRLDGAPDAHRELAAALRRTVAPLLRPALLDDAETARALCAAQARQAAALPATDPPSRLLADRTAEALLGLRRAINGLVLIVAPGHEAREPGGSWLHVPDYLPAIVNALRVTLAIAAAELVWVATAWPSGPTLIVFTAVTVILFSPRAEQAYGIVVQFTIGAVTAACLAAVVDFAVLPGQQSFWALTAAIGVVLVPVGALSAGDWHKFLFTGASMLFVPLLSPSNPQTYDLAGFLNGALPIVVGTSITAASLRLLPPLSAGWRTERLLALALRDLRRLAAGGGRRREDDWVGLMAARLAALPESATPLQLAWMVAALSAGESVVWLHRHMQEGVAEGLAALARGEADAAGAALSAFAQTPCGQDGPALRARAEAAVIADALARHPQYFAATV